MASQRTEEQPQPADSPAELPADAPLDAPSALPDSPESATASTPVAHQPRRRGDRSKPATDGPKRKSTMRLWGSAYKRLRDHCHYREIDPGDLVSRLILSNVPEYTIAPVKRGMTGSINEQASEENSAA